MEDNNAQELELSENSLKVLQRRYLKKDDRGQITESPSELFRRVARAIAEPDRKFGASTEEIKDVEDRFYAMMRSFDFMPNSPTLMNAGRPLGQLSACFVLPIEDSMESIFDAVKHTALIHKSGGGTGFAFSRLRPRNSMVASTSGVASGPISFMRVINAATEAVKQGGTRRGANMGILRVDHPDILDFISCKANLSELTNFNISVAVTDTFMRAVEEKGRYELIDPRTGSVYMKDGKPVCLDARTVFNNIIKQAHATGEPGLMFIDRMNEGNPVSRVGLYESTNPCGEQPLLPYESCNLGSINLSKMVRAVVDLDSPRELYRYEVDWEKLERTVRLTVHFLDNVIEANKYPLPEIDFHTKENRKIGLGIMGWADMLILLGIRYNSDEALNMADKVASYIKQIGHDESRRLGERRGVFPLWSKSVYYEGGEGPRMRNSTVTTIAPTGTISIIAGCSSGIEPLFAISYIRTVMDKTKMVEVNPIFEKVAKARNFYSTQLMEKIAETNSISDCEEIPEEVRRVFVTTHDVSPEWHVRMQAAFQKHTDNAVSKTINLPNGATDKDVEQAYMLAFKLGCKGITIYRDGSRAEQVLSTKATKDPQASPADQLPDKTRQVMERPQVLHGFTEKIKTGYGNLYVTVNTIDGFPFEVFAQIGKSGYSTMADTEAICRLISLAFRSGVPVGKVIEQLKGIGGSSPVFGDGGLISSIPDAIAHVLNNHFGNGMKIHKELDISEEFCPDCGHRIEHDSGCVVCRSCGYSRC
jgi:ribonucleoside-diphosphate reductase alpha chain